MAQRSTSVRKSAHARLLKTAPLPTRRTEAKGLPKNDGREMPWARDGTTISTRERILAAAMHHFADVGLAHASVRAITRLAGVNSALIRYHFGSKKALYVEVLGLITKRLVEVRIQALQALRASYGDKPIPLDALLQAYAAPIFPRAQDDLSKDAAIYLRFFGRIYTEPSDELRDIVQAHFTDLQNQYIDHIAKAVPHVTRQTVVVRFGMLIGALAFLGAKMGIIGLLSGGKFDEEDSQTTLAHFVVSFVQLFNARDLSN